MAQAAFDVTSPTDKSMTEGGITVSTTNNIATKTFAGTSNTKVWKVDSNPTSISSTSANITKLEFIACYNSSGTTLAKSCSVTASSDGNSYNVLSSDVNVSGGTGSSTTSTGGIYISGYGGSTTVTIEFTTPQQYLRINKDGKETWVNTIRVYTGSVGPIAVEKVTLNKTTLTLETGQNETLTATVIPDNAANKNLSWDSDNKAVATVDEDGKVSALTAGTANITVTTEDGGKTATCAVTVTAPAAPIEVESISIKEATTIAIGSSETLTVNYTPADANTGKEVTWSSSDATVATVDANGKVTGLKAGTATITATSKTKSAITASCTVTIKAVSVTGVTITPATATVKVDGTTTLSYSITPDNATDKTVSWSSDNESVATVDANGKVSGKSEGTATITVKTTDGNKTATCIVTVQTGTPLPDVGLKTHTPEIYEDPKGYNTPLVKFKDREYEVYYTAKGKIGGSGSGVPLVYVNESGNEISTATKAKDGWFEYQINSGDSEDKALTKDEFTVKRGTWKTTTDNYLVMQVKGYDQFRFFAAEKKDSDPNQQLHVFIDDLEHEIDTMKHSTSATIREFNISTDEHVIKITATGSSNQYIYGWSLRVSDEPLVRYLAGPKDQTVYQTKDIQRVAFRVRRAASHRLTWVGGKAIDGVTLREGGNDSVYVEGTANAAAGTYIYKLEALDKDGEVRSSEQGTITIQTHIFDAPKGNDFTTNVAEEIKPLSFLFYASEQSAITLNTDIDGLALTFANDSTVRLTGTPALTTTEGEHTYSITAAGGNTITGVITVVVPDPYFEPFAEAKTKDRMAITFAITARHASNVTIQGLPEGFTVRYDANTDKATVSGTPNIGGGYPKTFDFTATASPRYVGKTETSTSGKLIVVDPAATAVLVTTKRVDKLTNEPIAKYLNDELHYDITFRQQDVLAGSSYGMFDLVLISEDVDANNPEIFKIMRGGVDLPILNMKAFSYAHSIDSLEKAYGGSWGEADNGSLSENGKYITVWRDDHPIFKALNKKQGDRIQVLDSIDRRGLMPIKVTKKGGLCLATALKRDLKDYYGNGDPETFMHENPADLSGGNSKYISFPISLYSSKYLSNDGKKLLKATIEYLLNDKPSVEAPDARIVEFKLGDIVVKPDIGTYTILLEIDTIEHPELADLTHVIPEITLASQYTFTIPAQDSAVNMSYAPYMAFNYIVSDYIQREVYEIKVVWRKPQGIEEVYSVGEWVNVYDIFGRKVATTNEDIYTMSLPRGVYIIVTENGQTLKISR